MAETFVAQVVKLLDTYKAQAAFLVPLAITVLGVVANWIATGEFDTTEIRGALSGLVLAVAAALGAWAAPAGRAQVRRADSGAGVADRTF